MMNLKQHDATQISSLRIEDLNSSASFPQQPMHPLYCYMGVGGRPGMWAVGEWGKVDVHDWRFGIQDSGNVVQDIRDS